MLHFVQDDGARIQGDTGKSRAPCRRGGSARAGAERAGGYLPVKRGARFSVNALMPSLKSSDRVINIAVSSSSTQAAVRSVNRCS